MREVGRGVTTRASAAARDMARGNTRSLIRARREAEDDTPGRETKGNR
jgi:hypothetical protein